MSHLRFKRILSGKTYRYDPVMIDSCDPRTGKIPRGARLKVVTLAGGPPPGTLGHCHAELHGDPAGMIYLICVNSLISETNWKTRMRAEAAEEHEVKK